MENGLLFLKHLICCFFITYHPSLLSRSGGDSNFNYTATSSHKLLSEGASLKLTNELSFPSQEELVKPIQFKILIPIPYQCAPFHSSQINIQPQASYQANRFLFNQWLYTQNFIIMKFINQKGTNIYTCNFMSTLL